MTNKEILETAIQKAIDGGWQPQYTTLDSKYLAQAIVSGVNHYEIIFNHDFAKALWGEEWSGKTEEAVQGKPRWKVYLRQMVIAEDPIKYLGDKL